MATDITTLTINLSSDVDLENIVISGQALLSYVEEALGEKVEYKLTGKNKGWFDLDEEGNLAFPDGFDRDLLNAGKAKVSFEIKESTDIDTYKEIFDLAFTVDETPSLLQLEETLIQNSGGSLGAVEAPDATGNILSVTVVGSNDFEAVQQTVENVTSWVIRTKDGVTDLGSDDIDLTLNIVTDAGEFYADAIQVLVNDAPVAEDDSGTGLATDEDTALTISIGDLIDNDSDVDIEDTITAASLIDFSQPENGSLVRGGDGELIYTPDADYNGPDSFTYTIEDGRGGSDTATVSLIVNAVNDAPVAAADDATVNANESVDINLADNDTDIDNDLDLTSINIDTEPSNGSVQVNNDGTVTYTSTALAAGSDSFTYTIADVSGAVSAPATVNITVDAPLGIDGSGQDGYISGALVWSDIDGDGIYDEGLETSGITNNQGDFSLSGDVSGTLYLTGGVDIATLLEFDGVMRAPAGSTVITPITTLVVAVMEADPNLTQAEAEALVKSSLSLDASIDISNYDPIEVLSTSTDPVELEKASAVFATGSQLLNTVKVAGSAVSGSSSGTVTSSDAEQSTYDAFANLVLATNDPEPTSTTVNLTDTATIESVVQTTATTSGLDEGTVDSANVTTLITASNTKVEETVAESPDGASLLTGVSEVSQVTQSETAEAVSDGEVSTEDLDSYTAAGLDQQVDEAVTGDVDGTTDPESQDEILIGTSGADVIDGGLGNDTISGAAGDDTLSGGDGADTVSGGTGNDTIDGGLGNDTIAGQGGADTLIGGEGDDRVTAGTGKDTIIAGPGNDTYQGDSSSFDILDFSGAAGPVTVDMESGVVSDDGDGGTDSISNIDRIVGTSGNDTILGRVDQQGQIDRFRPGTGDDYIDGRGGNDAVDYRDINGSVTIDLGANGNANGTAIIKDAGGNVVGTDTILNVNRAFGTDSNDQITGDNTSNVLWGESGDDSLRDGDGNDALYGGAGADAFVISGLGEDYIGDFERGSDKIDLREMSTYLDPVYLQFQLDNQDPGDNGTFIDLGNGATLYVDGLDLGEELDISDFVLPAPATGLTLTGDEFDNILVGDTGDDTINAGLGNDILEGGAGNDILTVDNPADLFGNSNVFIAGPGYDTFQGAVNSFDTLDFRGTPGAINLDLETGPDGEGTVFEDGYGGSDSVFYINKVYGGDAGDILVGRNDGTIERFTGGPGDDTIDGRGGSNDGIDYRDTENDIGVQVDLGSFGDADGRANDPYGDTDRIFNIERVYGTPNNDLIWGDNLDNRFIGAGGADYIDGRGGDDWLFNNGDEDQGLVVDLARDLSPEGSFNVDNNGYGQSGGTIINVERIFGTNNDDFIYGNAEANFFIGGGGADTLSGGEGNDTIVAGNLDDAGDILIDGAGADYLEGGVGADTFIIEGFSGQDQQDNIGDFEQGIDVIDLTQAPTFISAQQLQTQLDQNAQGDIDFGFDGGTYLQLGSDSNLWISHDDSVSQLTLADFNLNDPGTGITLNGTSGNDTYIDDNNDTSLRGTQGDDIINGLAGDDNLESFGGNDELYGGADNDNLSGGSGNDTLDGGTGGQDGVNYDSWQFLSQRGVTINLGSGQWWDDTQAGEARDPDGGIDQLTGIESVSGSQFGDAVHVGNGADTGMEIPSFFDSYYFSFNGQSGNDYLESVGDVYVNFAPGESEFVFDEFGNEDFTAGDRFYGNGTGNLNMAEWQFSDQESGVQIYFGFEGQEGQAYGPNVRVFFNGITDANGGKNDDQIYGNEQNNTLSGEAGNDILADGAGADYLEGGVGADTFIIEGFSGQDQQDNIGDFEQGIDVIDLTQAPTFISAQQLQTQLDQNAQGDIDFGFDGGTYLQLGSESNLWISHDDSVSQLTLADFNLNDPGTGITLNGTSGNDTYIDDNNDTSLRGTQGDDIINGLAGDDNLESFGGNDELYGGADNDNLSGGSGNDTLDGGTGGQDGVNYDSWQFLSQRGVTINLGSGQWWDDTQAGEARDPDGGIDQLTGIESVSGSQFGDAVHVGNGADTGMEIPSFFDSYYFSFNGQSGNDYLESVGDVYVNFAPGESEFVFDEFGNEDFTAGDRFYGNGTGNLNMAEWQFSDQESGVQIYFGFEGQEGQAYGPNVRVFFNGITDANGGKNDDQIYGNEQNNILSGEAGNDILADGAGADYLEGGVGADTFIIEGFSGQDQQDNIGDFEQGIDVIDLTQAPTFISAQQLQTQLDQNAQGDIDFGFDGGTYLQLGSESNLWISHDDSVSQLTLADFNLNDPGTGITLNGTSGNDTYIDDNNDTSLRGTQGDDIINGLAGDDNLESFGGNDELYGGADNDNLSGGSGNDTLDGGTGGQDGVNYDSWQFLSQRGVTINLGSGQWWDDTQAGEARDPDGGIDQLTGIESVSGSQFGDAVHVGNGADTGMEIPSFFDSYYFSFNGQSGNDYLESVGDVYVNFAPGESEFVFDEFGNEDFTAGDRFYGNGTGNLNMAEWQFSDQESGVQIYFGFEGQEGQAYGPNVRVFFNGITDANGGKNDDQIYGNEQNNTLSGEAGNDILADGAGADYLEGGVGADTFIIEGFSGQDQQDNIGDFEQGIDVIDLTQAPTFISAQQLQTQLDQNAQGDIDFGFDGGTYLQLGSESNLWISHDDSVSQLTLADFNLNDPGTGITLNGTSGNDTYIDDNNDTSLRGTQGDDIINGLAGDDNLESFGGNDELYGGADNDNLSGGSGNDTLDGGTGGQDGVNYDSWQFLSQRGVTINLGSGQWWDDTQAGEARDPDGGIDQLTGIESVSGSQFGDAVHVGNGADTGMEIPSFFDSYYFSFNGQSGNDYLESVGDVYVNFAPGESEFVFDEFGNEDFTAGDRFYGNGTGNLNMAEWQFSDQESGVQIYFGFEGQEGQAYGPNVRVFFNGITDANGGKNSDELRGNELDNALRGEGGDDILADGAGADYLEGGAGADRFVIQGFSGPGLQDTIGDFEQSLDKIDLTQAPVFVTAAQLQAQIDQQAQGDIDNGFDGGTSLQLGSESNLWISHDDSVSQLTLADFVLNDPGTGIEITGTTGNDTYIDDNNDTSLRGTEGDDIINGLAGDDNIDGFGGNDVLNGDEGDDNISAGAGGDEINGGAGQDNANYDSWQFLSQRGVTINLGSGQWWDDTQAGEARDPDGGIDQLTGIESVSGSQFGDAVHVGNGADTGMEIPSFFDSYYFSFNGQSGNDYLESVGDVYVNFAPGESEFVFDEFGNEDFTAGDRFYGNGTGNLNMAEWQFSDQESGVQIYFGFEGQEGQAYGPNVRVFFNGITDANGGKNNDELRGNELDNALRGEGGDDILVDGAGADYLEGGAGADRFVIQGFSGPGLQDTIGDFEQSLDKIDLTQAPVFVTAAQLQAQIDQQAQGDIDNGFDGGTSLQLGSESNLWISHDDSVSQLTLADFVLPAIDPDQTLTGTEFDDQFVPYAEDPNFRTGSGVDTVNAGAGNDNIEGNAGDDFLYGEDGSDNISAGQGNDTIDGGAGGEDNANYDSWQFLSQNGVSINLGAGEWDGLATGEARDPDGGIDNLTGIESVTGSQFGDALRIGFAADTGMEIPSFADSYYFSFNGQSGNDYLESVGDVYVNFSPGESELFFDEFGNDLDTGAGDYFNGNGTGNLNMSEGQFNDQDSGVQIYFGFEGQEGRAHGPNVRVFFNGITDANGGKNNDELRGNELDNALRGEGGDDILVGFGGNNTLSAGNGFDTAAYTTAPAGIVATGSIQDFDGDGGSDVVYDISNGYGGTDTVVNAERIEGTAFDDVMTGANTDPDTGPNQRFIGGEGSDRIDGGTGTRDGIDHRFFDNGVSAAGNNSNGITVDLNPIIDELDPNVGWGTVIDEFGFTDYVKNIERVYATANDDSLTGDGANNIFIAGDGQDFVDGGDGFDWWWTNGSEDQSVIIDLSTNTVTNDGNGFTETIFNIEGVFGAGQNDTLIGNAEGNNLIAFDGDDTLEGLGGDDYLDGGNGADLFIFDANSGNDTIGGFNNAEDKLQLSDGLTITSATLIAAQEDGVVNDTLLNIDNGTDFVTVTLLDVELAAHDIILI